MDEFLGVIKIFGGNFAPLGWFTCNGQLLAISQYQALFSIIGTTYGGNGVTTFALPNLQGRVPIGMGKGPGLSAYVEGQTGGTEINTLLLSNIPPHNHPASLLVNNTDSGQGVPTVGSSLATPGTLTGRTFTATLGYNTATPNTALNAASVATGLIGQGQPVNNMQPFIAMNYVISWQGVYPARP